jgi:5'-nucleotidase
VLGPLLAFETEPRTLINVNFPALPPDEVRGVHVCRQGLRDYGRVRIVRRKDPRGYDYYWFGLGPMVETPGHLTDLEAIADGFVSVTPLHLDLTHEGSLDALHERFAATP